MLYIERKPAPPLRSFVRSLWYMSAPGAEHRHERILPSGCAHIVLTLSRDFLTDCLEGGSEQRTAPVLIVGQRSVYEIIATADLVDLAGVLFAPGALPALVADRADLLSNRNVPLDQVWRGYADTLRSRMLEGLSPQARLQILEDCLAATLLAGDADRRLNMHPAVRFALEQFARDSNRLSIAGVAQRSGWSERRFSQIFREQVGFAPKVWCRLQRFQRAVRQLRAGADVPWAELAIECGFYDQAHLANEFRSFSGIDLTTYIATQKE
ncbi:MAG TPA: AraC family transcriptional regulator [Bryobacteraceae bacterium]